MNHTIPKEVTNKCKSVGFGRPRYPEYANMTARVNSFQYWPRTCTQKPEDMAKSGFLYAGYGDYACCFFCGGGLRNWEAGDDPWVEHARWFPRCQYLRQNKNEEFIQHVQELHQAQKCISVKEYIRKELHTANQSDDPLSKPMNIEVNRLESFRTFPLSSKTRPIKLAKSGFFYTGHGDRVHCYSCGIIYRNWKDDDEPNEVHKRISPLCKHVNGSDTTNVPIAAVPTSNLDRPSSDQTNGHQISCDHSLMSFSSKTDTENQVVGPSASNNILPLAVEGASRLRSGRVNSRHDTSTQNSSRATGTSSTLDDTEGSQNHTGRSGITRETDRCPNIQTDPPERENTGVHNNAQHLDNPIVASNTTDRNGQLPRHLVTQRLNSLGINIDKPRYPAYATIMARLGSFENWPTTLTQKPEDMAKSGFLYAGYGDYARCFFCGGGLRNWEAGDDPWIEHARWFPQCEFLRQEVDNDIIQIIQNNQQNREYDFDHSNCAEFRLHQVTKTQEQTGFCKMNKFSHQMRIFSCCISNEIWKEEENLWVVHAKDSAYCQNIISAKGSGFSTKTIQDDLEIDANPYQEAPENVPIPAEATQNEVDQVMASVAVSSVASDNSHDTPVNFDTEPFEVIAGSEGAAGLDKFHVVEDFDNLKRENFNLKNQRLCTICCQSEVAILFFPCRHLISCTQCAPPFIYNPCPLCRTKVLATKSVMFG